MEDNRKPPLWAVKMPSALTRAGTAAPECAQRFTLDGGQELERRIQELCAQVADAVIRIVLPGKLEALVLGGGYGRGQGGVLKTTSGEYPYNDLEFYVFLRGNRLINQAKFRPMLDRAGELLSAKAGLHVEFKIDSLTELKNRPVSIFSYDLVSGHRVICGERKPFRGCERHLSASAIVPTESTRLLLNRCSGLLLAQERLLQPVLSADDCDFIGRNLAKTQLALGDAFLAAHGQYHWSCLERAERLSQFRLTSDYPELCGLLKHHASGVSFKLHPQRVVRSADQFKTEIRELADLAMSEWLWIENRRLRSNFSNLRDYAFSPVHKCKERHALRNLLLNVRTFGAKASLDRCGPRYPRERLLNTLPLLLASHSSAIQSDISSHLRRQLRTTAQDWQGFVKAYKQVWSCYG